MSCSDGRRSRPRIGSHLLADGPQDQIERWVVGAAQAEPGAERPSSIRARTPRADDDPRAGTVTPRHQPERLQAPVGAAMMVPAEHPASAANVRTAGIDVPSRNRSSAR